MESALLGVAGDAGLVVAFTGTRALLALAFRGSHYVPISPAPSLPVLAFTCVVSVLAGLAFGVAPALLACRFDSAETLRAGNRATRDRSGLPQRSLVVVQTALSLVLLAGAGLLSRSLANLETQDFGFATEGRLIVKRDDGPSRAWSRRPAGPALRPSLMHATRITRFGGAN